MKPNSDNPARNAARRNAASNCDVFLRTPISGIAVRCANAKNGHAPAEPAISLMKSRRLIACPLGSGQGIVATQTRTGKGPAHVRFTPGRSLLCNYSGLDCLTGTNGTTGAQRFFAVLSHRGGGLAFSDAASRSARVGSPHQS